MVLCLKSGWHLDLSSAALKDGRRDWSAHSLEDGRRLVVVLGDLLGTIEGTNTIPTVLCVGEALGSGCLRGTPDVAPPVGSMLETTVGPTEGAAVGPKEGPALDMLFVVDGCADGEVLWVLLGNMLCPSVGSTLGTARVC